MFVMLTGYPPFNAGNIRDPARGDKIIYERIRRVQADWRAQQ
jgi:hypothetical protein